MRIIFLGSAEFGLPALRMLLERHEVAAVVSTPARPKGRGLKLFDSPVVEFARERGIAPVLTPDDLRAPEFIRELKSIGADIFVVAAFRVLHRDVYTIPKFGTVNIHASLLPRYRGAAPIHRAIEAGERETGVTIFRIDDGIDTGEILTQKKIPIGDDEATPELYDRLSVLGAEALRESLDALERGAVKTIRQESAEATRAPKLTREEGRINWTLPAFAIYNKVRAFKPFPGTYFFISGKRINIEQAAAVEVDAKKTTAAQGEILYSKGDHIDIQCGGGVLRVTKVKPEGRSSMDVKAFLLGHTITEGTILE